MNVILYEAQADMQSASPAGRTAVINGVVKISHIPVC